MPTSPHGARGQSNDGRSRVNSGEMSGNSRTYCHQYGPARPAGPYAGNGPGRPAGPYAGNGPGRPAVPYTGNGPARPARPYADNGPARPARPYADNGPVRPAGPYADNGPARPAGPSQLGQCIPSTNGGHPSGRAMKKSSKCHKSAVNPLLLSLLSNNQEAAPHIGGTSQSGNPHSLRGQVNCAARYAFQQKNGSLGANNNNNNSQSLETGGQHAGPFSTTSIDVQLNGSGYNLQKPVAGYQPVLPGRQGAPDGLEIGRGPNQVNHHWTVFSGQDSSRIPVYFPQPSGAPTSCQRSQESHCVAPRPSTMSPPNSNQSACRTFQNAHNINRTGFTYAHHGEPVTTGPSIRSQMISSPPLKGINNQFSVPNSSVGQFMPKHSHNPQHISSRHVSKHPASDFIAPTQEHNRTGAIGKDAHHSTYHVPCVPDAGYPIHYHSDTTHALVSNTGPSSSVPDNGAQSSIQRINEMPLPPYSGQRSRGPVQNQTGCAVETDASAGQKVPNRNPTQRYAQVLKSDTASSSPVPNHCIQFQGQQNCESTLPSYPIRQGYYITVAEDTSVNGSRADNVLFFMGDKPNEGASVLQGSTASSASSFLTPQKAVAVVQPLSPCAQRKTPVDGADKMPLSLSTGDVSNHGEESSRYSSQARTTLTKSHFLTDTSEQVAAGSRVEDASEAGSGKTLAQISETMDVEKSTAHSLCEFEIPQASSLSSLRHVYPLNEETQVVPHEDIFDLASVSVINWTLGKLKELVESIKPEECSVTLASNKILSLYWDGNGEKLLDAMRSNVFADIFKDVQSFFGDYGMSPQSDILFEVRHENWVEVRKKCDVFEHDSVHPRIPEHKSLWLNTNEQLDDIDKEFGFPLSLMGITAINQRPVDLKPVCTENEVFTDTSSNYHTEELTLLKRPTCAESESKEIEVSKLTQPSTQAMSSVNGEGNGVMYDDPFSSLVINVLQPEEAIRFYCGRLLQDNGEDEQPIELDVDVKVVELKNDSVEDVSFTGEDVKVVELSNDSVEDVSFTGEDVKVVELKNNSVEDVSFTGEDVKVVELRNYSVEDVSFTGKDVKVVELRNESVEDVSFTGEDVKVVELRNNSLEDVSFTGEDVKVVELSNDSVEDVPKTNDFCCLSQWLAVFTGSSVSSCECHAKTETVSAKALRTTNGTTEGMVEKKPSDDAKHKSTGVAGCYTIVLSDSESDSAYNDGTRGLDLSDDPSLPLIKCSNVVEVQDVFSNYDDFLKVAAPMSELVWDNIQPTQKHVDLPLMNVDYVHEERSPRAGEYYPTVSNSDINLPPQQTKKICLLTSLSLAQRTPKHLSPQRNRIGKGKQKLKRRLIESPNSKLSLSGKRRKIKDRLGPKPDVHWTGTNFDPPSTATTKSLTNEQPLTAPEIGNDISRASTVSLTLFGSKSRRENGTPATLQHKNNTYFRPRIFSDKAIPPPETLNVNVNFSNREPSDAGYLVEGPVKLRILNEWKSCFVPNKSKRVLRRQNKKDFVPKIVEDGVAAVASGSKTVMSSKRRDTTDRPVNTKRTLRLIERERIFNGLRQQLKRSGHEVVTPSISNAFEIGKRSEKNNVLQFSVLPETFNFKDEPAPMDTPAPNSSRKEMTDPVSLETKSPEVKVNGAPGGWTKCHKIPRKSTTTEGTKSSFTLFQEFLKKVKQK